MFFSLATIHSDHLVWTVIYKKELAKRVTADERESETRNRKKKRAIQIECSSSFFLLFCLFWGLSFFLFSLSLSPAVALARYFFSFFFFSTAVKDRQLKIYFFRVTFVIMRYISKIAPKWLE